MPLPLAAELPSVATWRLHALRLSYLLIAAVMGFFVWQQLLFEAGPWPAPRVIAKSMLASLALLSLLGLRYPLQMLPLLLLETLWKTLAIGLVIVPAWLGDRLAPDLRVLFDECIGVVVLYAVMPWPYVWARYVRHPAEAWRGGLRAGDAAPGSAPR